jgi:hypothetical protein
MNCSFTSFQQVAFALFVAFATLVPASAQTTVFQGQMYGLWSDAANWSAGLPQKGMTAIVPGGTAVSLDKTMVVDFAIDAQGHISVLQGVIITFEQSLSFNTVANAGQMVFKADATIAKSMNNLGTLRIEGYLLNNGILTNQRAIISTGQLDNHGQLVNSGSISSLGMMSNHGNITNAKGAVVAVREGSIYYDATTPADNAVAVNR